jgi:hypothetical protein
MDLIDPHVAAETAHYVAATLATYPDDLGLDDALSHAKARHERQRIRRTGQELSGWFRTPDGVSSLALCTRSDRSLTAYEAPSWEPSRPPMGARQRAVIT